MKEGVVDKQERRITERQSRHPQRTRKKLSKFTCQVPKPQNPLPANNIPFEIKLGSMCYS